MSNLMIYDVVGAIKGHLDKELEDLDLDFEVLYLKSGAPAITPYEMPFINILFCKIDRAHCELRLSDPDCLSKLTAVLRVAISEYWEDEDYCYTISITT